MTQNKDWKPPLAFRPHCAAHWAGNFGKKAAGSFLGKKGFCFKGGGAVPLAEKQLKLLKFLIIADGRRNASQGKVGEENSPVCDRKRRGLWVIQCLGKDLQRCDMEEISGN